MIALYAMAYIMVLLGLSLCVGDRVNAHACRAMIVIGTITALATACLYTF